MAILESVFLVALRSGVGCIWTPVEIFSRLNDWTETFVSSNQVKCLHASKIERIFEQIVKSFLFEEETRDEEGNVRFPDAYRGDEPLGSLAGLHF